MLATAGRRAFLILSLILALAMNGGAQLPPVIGSPAPPVIGGQSVPVIGSQSLPPIGGPALPPIGSPPSPPIGGRSLPVIVQISPTANITAIASTLGATVIDNIFGTNIYLLNIAIGPLVNPGT